MKILFAVLITFSFLIEFPFANSSTYAQSDPEIKDSVRIVHRIIWFNEKFDTIIRKRNTISYSLYYMFQNSPGGSISIYKRINNGADFFGSVGLHFSADSRKYFDYDTAVSKSRFDREKRVITLPFCIGIQKYFLQSNTDWDFKPIVIGGFVPSLVIAIPYHSPFFQSLKKSIFSFGFGFFVGGGIDWQVKERYSLSFTFRYSFVPILARDIYFYKALPLNTVGGFQLTLGFTFVKRIVRTNL